MSIGKGLFAALLLMGLVLTGCGGDDDVEEDEAKAEVCESVGSLESGLKDLALVNADTPISSIKSQFEEIAGDLVAIVENAENVKDLEVDDVQQAMDDLETAVTDLDDSQSTSDALAALQAPIAEVQTAVDDLQTRTDCQDL